jgi:hypothetical protein
MNDGKKFKGPWVQRLGIIFLAIVLGVLLYWLLGFITRDIDSIRGPDRTKIESKYVNAELLESERSLKENLAAIKEDISNKQEEQRILRNSTDNLQTTINQLLSIQKLNIEKNLSLPEEQQKVLVDSQTRFLENQKDYQSLNKDIAGLTKQQHQVQKKLDSVKKEIQNQRNQGWVEYRELTRRHRWRLAALKLAVMIPIFLIAAWLFIRKRSGTYWSIVYAVFIAVFVRILLVLHQYFPRRYFKYIVLFVIIAIVLRLLVYLIQLVVSPKKEAVLKQYQEAYDKFLCPVCSKPIRIGPLRYSAGRSRKSAVSAGQGGEAMGQELYTCPSCGSQLYEKCDKCSGIRHSLLPFCEHCGNENPNWS